MPELPEVETVVRYLSKMIKNSKVTNIDVAYPNILKNIGSENYLKNILQGHVIKNINRRGKYIIFHFDNTNLISHLRMEGKWYVEKQDTWFDPKHTLIRFSLDNGLEMRYNDTRRFGTLDIRNDEEINVKNPIAKLGYEPFDENLDVSYLKKCYERKNIAIKTILLDQTIIVGIGNIYACEICFYAKIHPEKIAKYLVDHELKDIINYTRFVLKKAIDLGGTTISSFHPEKGVNGEFVHQLQVYGRKNEKCYRCNSLIQKIKLNGRGTYYCPECQKF